MSPLLYVGYFTCEDDRVEVIRILLQCGYHPIRYDKEFHKFNVGDYYIRGHYSEGCQPTIRAIEIQQAFGGDQEKVTGWKLIYSYGMGGYPLFGCCCVSFCPFICFKFPSEILIPGYVG
jgi:hypothetical protein